MQSGYVNSFLVFVRQHQEMKTSIMELKRMLECFEDKNDGMSSQNIVRKLEEITMLTIDHIEREEREIMPILKQMYDPQMEIAEYIKNQHDFITKELNELIYCLQPYKNVAKDLTDSLFFSIQEILEEIMVHFFEEENGLFPLLQSYLKST
jgi:hemerythrin-like domain-containing protein